MRTITKFFAAALCAAVALPMSAQEWAGNEPADGTFYLYNVGAKAWFCGANSWGTHASVTEKGGLDVTLAAAEGGYTIDTQISNGGNSHFLNGEWCDGGAMAWAFEPVDGSNAYYISSVTKNDEETVIKNLAWVGEEGNTNLALNDETGVNAQWILVTRQDRIDAMAGATPENPVDVTFLLACPNFGRNDLRFNNAWKGGATRGGAVENMCAEKFNCAFDVYQEVTDVPQGVYILEFQGFYRYGGHGSEPAIAARAAGTEELNTTLYANTSEAPLMSILDEQNCPYGVTYSDGHTYPNSMTDASNAFLAGLYNTKMEFYTTASTLKIGVKKTALVTNDWTIYDNCRLTYVTPELPIEAYAEVYEKTLANAQEALDDPTYANVTGDERSDLKDLLSQTTFSTKAEYSAAQAKVDAALSAFKAAKESYDAYAEAKKLTISAYKYATEDAKTEFNALKFANKPSTAEEAEELAEELTQAARVAAEEHAQAASVDDATDISELIVNPDADEAIDEPWAVVLGEDSPGALGILSNEPWTDADGNSTHAYFDGGSWGNTAWDVQLVQNITLPKGKYLLSAMARASAGLDSFVIFAGENKQEMPHVGATGALFNNGWNNNTLEFTLSEETELGIGVQGVTTSQYQWMSFSKFRLVQLEGDKVTVGIETVATEQPADARIYNLQGQQVKNAQKGLFIVNGKKVIR